MVSTTVFLSTVEGLSIIELVLDVSPQCSILVCCFQAKTMLGLVGRGSLSQSRLKTNHLLLLWRLQDSPLFVLSQVNCLSHSSRLCGEIDQLVFEMFELRVERFDDV